MIQPRPQRLSFHVRHDVEQEITGLAGIEQRENVRVGETRRDLDLAQESLGADFRGQFWSERLEGDLPVMALIPGEEDDCHPTLTELPLNGVSAAQAFLEALNEIRHVAVPIPVIL